MKIRFHNVQVIFLKEILDVIRDKRTLFGIILLPLIIYPLLFIGFSEVFYFQQKKLIQRQSLIFFCEPEKGEPIIQFLERGRIEGIEIDEKTQERMRNIPEKWLVVRYEKKDDYEKLITDKLLNQEIQVGIWFKEDILKKLKTGKRYVVNIYYNGASERSRVALDLLKSDLRFFSLLELEKRLKERELDLEFAEPISVDTRSVVSEERETAHYLSKVIAMLLITLTCSACFYPAVDMGSGEKERGTMETLLVSGALRSEIVLGKFLAVFVVSIVSALLNLLSMAITFSHFVGKAYEQVGESFKAMPLEYVIVALVPMIPLCGIFSSLSLGLSFFASSYKEAMVYMSPLMFVAMAGGFFAMLPGIDLEGIYLVVPIVNSALFCRELISGNFDLAKTSIVFASSAVYMFLSLRWTWDIFKREDILFRIGKEFRVGKKVAVIKKVLPDAKDAFLLFCIVLICAFFIVGQIVPIFGDEGLNIFLQSLLTQVGVFFLIAFIFAKLCYVNLKETFKMKGTSILSLLLILFIVVAFYIVMMQGLILIKESGIFEEEEFKEYSEKIEGYMHAISPLGLFIVLVMMPMICEEFLFRGFILSGFQNSWGWWKALFITSLLFAFMHFTPTRPVIFLLGLLIGFFVLRSGSIITGIFAHGINNFIAFFLLLKGREINIVWLREEKFAPLPITCIAIFVVIVGIILYAILIKPKAIKN